jgi:hypothetical protein
LNYLGIRMLKIFGLAKDIKVVNLPEKLAEQEKKLATGRTGLVSA